MRYLTDVCFHFWRRALACLLWLCFLPLVAQADVWAEKITTGPWFSTPVVWVGESVPGDAESKALSESLEGFAATHRVSSVEGFVAGFPESAWTPSGRAHLAHLARQKGRYTAALQEWELAWAATKHFTNGPGKLTGDFTLAHWSQLLASLGRHERLAELFRETEGRVFGALPETPLPALLVPERVAEAEGLGQMEACQTSFPTATRDSSTSSSKTSTWRPWRRRCCAWARSSAGSCSARSSPRP